MRTYYQFNKRNSENDVFCFYVGYKKMLKIIPKVEYVAYPDIFKSFIRFSSCETKNNNISIEKNRCIEKKISAFLLKSNPNSTSDIFLGHLVA